MRIQKKQKLLLYLSIFIVVSGTAGYSIHERQKAREVVGDLFAGTCPINNMTAFEECFKSAKEKTKAFFKLKDEELRYDMLMDACLHQGLKTYAGGVTDQLDILEGKTPRGDSGRCHDKVILLVN